MEKLNKYGNDYNLICLIRNKNDDLLNCLMLNEINKKLMSGSDSCIELDKYVNDNLKLIQKYIIQYVNKHYKKSDNIGCGEIELKKTKYDDETDEFIDVDTLANGGQNIKGK